MERKAFLDSLNFLLPLELSCWPKPEASSNESSDGDAETTVHDNCSHGFWLSVEPVLERKHDNEEDESAITVGPVMTKTTSADEQDPAMFQIELAVVPAETSSTTPHNNKAPSPAASSASTSLSVSQSPSKLLLTTSPHRSSEGSGASSSLSQKSTSSSKKRVLIRIDKHLVYQIDMQVSLQSINMVVRDGSIPSSLELSFDHCLWRIFSERDDANNKSLTALDKDLAKARANAATTNVASLEQGDDNIDVQTAELVKTLESLKSLDKSLDMPVSVFSSSAAPSEIVGPILTNTAKSLAASYIGETNRARIMLDSEAEEYQKELEDALTVAFPPPRKKQRRGIHTIEDETPTKSFLEGGDDESQVLMQRVRDILEKQQQANTQKYRLALLPRRC